MASDPLRPFEADFGRLRLKLRRSFSTDFTFIRASAVVSGLAVAELGLRKAKWFISYNGERVERERLGLAEGCCDCVG